MKSIYFLVFIFFISLSSSFAQNPTNSEEEEEQLWKTEEEKPQEEVVEEEQADEDVEVQPEDDPSVKQDKKPKKDKKKKKKKKNVVEEEPEEKVEEPKDDYFGLDEDEDQSEAPTDTTQQADKKDTKRVKKGPGPILLALERFHFNLSSGYGITSWRSQIYNYNDTTDVRYKGLGASVPVNLQILYDFGKIRFGGGAQLEMFHMGKLKPSEYENVIPSYNIKAGTFKKFYGHLGYKYFENRLYSYVADIEAGVFKGSSSVNTTGNGMKPFVNVGVTLERNYSDYFRMFIKPSLEFKGQPFALGDNLPVNNHKLMTFYFQFGLSYSIPILPKCPVPGCSIRKRHNHKNRIFRGNPYQRLQNPNYGEEDRTLIKYRGKNKRKLNPF